jgi:hypothetical protein
MARSYLLDPGRGPQRVCFRADESEVFGLGLPYAVFEDLSEIQHIFHARRVIWPECITPSGRWPEIPPHRPTAQRHLETYRRLMASYVAERLSPASNVLSQQAARLRKLLKKASMPRASSLLGPEAPERTGVLKRDVAVQEGPHSDGSGGVVRMPETRHSQPRSAGSRRPCQTIDRAKVRILRFKNLPPFRHYRGLQNHV